MSPRRVTFRFGLTGQRWGDAGPVVLLAYGADTTPSTLAQLVEPLLATHRQVIALDDPSDAALNAEQRVTEYAYALEEAAVELPQLESIVGVGLASAAAAQARRELRLAA